MALVPFPAVGRRSRHSPSRRRTASWSAAAALRTASLGSGSTGAAGGLDGSVAAATKAGPGSAGLGLCGLDSVLLCRFS